jgi:hypothetical protein
VLVLIAAADVCIDGRALVLQPRPRRVGSNGKSEEVLWQGKAVSDNEVAVSMEIPVDSVDSFAGSARCHEVGSSSGSLRPEVRGQASDMADVGYLLSPAVTSSHTAEWRPDTKQVAERQNANWLAARIRGGIPLCV